MNPEPDLFTDAGTPDWVHVAVWNDALGRADEYRARVVGGSVAVERRLRPGEGKGDGWAPITWPERVARVARMAGVLHG
jgi:hypothetical protein